MTTSRSWESHSVVEDVMHRNCLNCWDDLPSNKSRYCSVMCSRTGGNLGFAGKSRGPSFVVCEYCGKDFKNERPSRPQRTCSRECRNLLRRQEGGRYVTNDGYVRVIVSDIGQPMRTELEHRVVMSEMLGRPLTRTETVHHKNGIRDDNRPENLELWTKNHGAGVRAADLGCECLTIHEYVW